MIDINDAIVFCFVKNIAYCIILVISDKNWRHAN